MKILKVVLISCFLLILVLAIAIVVFIKTFDINRYKPQIISQASSALKRNVDFEKAKLAFSVRQGVSLNIANLVIADDPAFAKENFLTVNNVALGIDLLGSITQRKIHIAHIIVDQFQATIIRQKDGSINLQSIAKPAESETAQKPEKGAAPAAMPALLISSLRGSGGTIVYLDYAFEPRIELAINDVQFEVKDISLTDVFTFTAEAAVLSAQRNIRLSGKAQLDLSTGSVTLSQIKGESDLSQVLLEKIPDALPMTKGVVLPASLKGAARLDIERMTAGPTGLVALAGNIALADGAVYLKELAKPIENIQAKAQITQAKIILDSVTASLGTGIIKGAGSVDNYLTSQEFAMAADAENLLIEDLVAADKAPVKAKGIASGTLQVKGQGFTPEMLSSSLSGSGSAVLKNIVLENMNVFQQVMGKLTMFPGIAAKIESALPERYKQSLAKKDTALSDMTLAVEIDKGRLIFRDTTVTADAFSLKSNAEVGFDGSYAMEGSFLIPEDLSAAMITKVPELEYLLGADKQILFPLKLSGKAAGVKLSVDAGYIAQKLIANQAKTQILKVIDKALKPKEPAAEPAPNP
ncbi:MAG: AsmA family protein [Candidatus Omnitrophica bacterium]|nr:AsmA family protein [Candidatus Omnitrophota bacterium]